jgi:hypothetical protein
MSLVADRLRAAIEAVVRALVPPVDGLALYEAQVTAWNESAQTGDLVPVAPSSPLPAALTAVPHRLDPPGTRVVLMPGTRVLVGFTDGDLARPEIRFADLPDTSGFLPGGTRIDLAAGTQGAARVGDSVDGGQLVAQTANVAGVPVVIGLWYQPAGSSTWHAISLVTTPPVPSTPTPSMFTGAVSSGSAKVRIG